MYTNKTRMKKILLLLTLICTMQIKAQTNVYHPIALNNAEWFQNSAGSSGCCTYTHGVQIGDTIVNSITYKKLYQQDGSYWPSYFTALNPLSYVGACRQDSAAKKVYKLPLGTGATEVLVYDFNLQVGSIITGTNGNHNDTVKKIDSMLIDGTYHKRYLVFDTMVVGGENFLIEGVGSSGNFLGPVFNYLQFEGSAALNCFNHNFIIGDGYYGTTCPVAITDIHQFSANNYLKIYPNPAQNNFTVEVSNTDKQTISVFDVNGKLILSQTITGTTNIDAGNLVAGVYNISITNNQSTTNKKLIIVR